jgi:plastocyanin
MTFRARILSVLATALVIAAAACGGETTASIIQTQQAENKNTNATATAQAGGSGGFTVGSGSVAEQQQQSFAATSTALAAAGGGATPTATPSSEVQAPEGPALTDADNPTIEITSTGMFVPEVIKVKVGTTVTWTTTRRSAISTTSLPGEAEQWDSGPMSKGTFDPGPATYQHTFTTLGCHRYMSTQSNERVVAAVCVEE